MNVTPSTIRLRESDRTALEQHFLALNGEDRRLRFGSTISDDGLRAYVARIDFAHDGLFAVHDEDLALAAVIHVAFSEGSAELGLSVLQQHRGRGMGRALFARAVTHLRNRGTREVYVHCLTENGAMMHLARTNKMRIVPAGSETDARLKIDPPTAESLFVEWCQDQQAGTMTMLRRNAKMSRALFNFVAPQFTR